MAKLQYKLRVALAGKKADVQAIADKLKALEQQLAEAKAEYTSSGTDVTPDTGETTDETTPPPTTP